jgi:predicted porin
MKKTLLAIAALAATSGAFAQSSVTLYGVLDASVENVRASGGPSLSRIASDNLATSRLGFKGSEDLGGGLRANFNLESAVKVDTGANGGGTSRFFDRAAWVGLQGGFGELRLGRIDSSIGALAGDTKILGAQPYDDLKIAPTRAGNGYRRVDNAITYLLPGFVSGLSAQLQYTTANDSTSTPNAETASVNAGKTYGLNVKYVAGPFLAGLGYLSARDEAVATAGNQKSNATLVFAGYDFGVVKLTGFFDSETKIVGGANRLTVAGLKVGVPFGSDFLVTAGVAEAKNVVTVANGATANGDHDDAVISTLKATYNLSKRTTVYGLFTNVNNEGLASIGGTSGTLNIAPVPAGKSVRGLAFGIAHAF